MLLLSTDPQGTRTIDRACRGGRRRPRYCILETVPDVPWLVCPCSDAQSVCHVCPSVCVRCQGYTIDSVFGYTDEQR